MQSAAAAGLQYVFFKLSIIGWRISEPGPKWITLVTYEPCGGLTEVHHHLLLLDPFQKYLPHKLFSHFVSLQLQASGTLGRLYAMDQKKVFWYGNSEKYSRGFKLFQRKNPVSE